MKILLLPRASGLSHVVRLLAIAEELERKGHQILFATSPNKTALIRKACFQNKEIFDFPEDDMGKNILRFGLFAHHTRAILKRMIKEELAIIKEYQPDLIIVDTRYSIFLTKQLVKIPLVSIATATHFSEFEQYIRSAPAFLRSLSEHGFQIGKKVILSFLNWRVKRIYHKLAHQFKVRPPTLIYDLFAADLRLIPEIPTYTPFKEMPANTFYIGPIFWQGFVQKNNHWREKIPDNKKVIYLTLGGTVFKKRIFEKIINELTKKDYFVIASCGPQFEPDEFQIETRRVILEKYIDGERACALAGILICPGGQGSVMQALKYGRPLLTIPHNLSQYYHSRRIVELKCGLTILRPFSPQFILKKVDVLYNNPFFQQNAKKLKEEIALYPGASMVVKLIEDFCKKLPKKENTKKGI